MAKKTKALNSIRKSATKIYKVVKRLFRKIQSGIIYIWHRPLIVSSILLVLAIFLFNLITDQAFKPYTNCNYLLGSELEMPSFFCQGHKVKVAGATVFSIPGLKDVMDPPLEFVRTIISWSIILFFGFLSLYLTIIINNLKSVVKLLTFNKREWENFMASARIWLLIFVVFCSIFYASVAR